MSSLLLVQKLRELCQSQATLLWLEGSQHTRVTSVKLQGGRLILSLADSTSRVVHFERFAVTAVGLQFWSQGRPGVLYRWDQVSRTDVAPVETSPEDPPPDQAA